jgi:nucleoside-triphosphatase
MSKTKRNILITGPPRVGKTTLIKKICERLKGIQLRGFYTEEIRQDGRRRGFKLISLDGREAVLADTEIKSPYRVSRYRVDIKGFERFLSELDLTLAEGRWFIIDEIGKMECFSDIFIERVTELLNSNCPVICTVAIKGGGFIKEVKERKDAVLFRLAESNREEVFQEILSLLQGLS